MIGIFVLSIVIVVVSLFVFGCYIGEASARAVKVTTLLIAAGCTLSAVMVGNHLSSVPEYEFSSVSVVAVQDNQQSSGGIFILVGGSSSNPIYTYYQESGGEISLERISADKAVIIEDASPNEARLVRIDNGWGTVKHEFHLPEGSVKRSFNLDAQY